MINPAILLATVIVVVLTALGVSLLGREAENLRGAKEDGFNSVLALSQARAIGNSLHGDQSRYLLDPERADTYEQVYLDKSQSVLYTPAGNLDKYYAGLDKVVGDYPGKTGFLGFFGNEALNATHSGERTALDGTLDRYRSFQQADRTLRSLANAKQTAPAIRHGMGPLSDTFESYDQAVVKLTTLHHQVFQAAIADGDKALGGWNLLLPGAALIAALLILLGVQPRLSEYR